MATRQRAKSESVPVRKRAPANGHAKKNLQPGPDALYRNKDRANPITLHLTKDNRSKLDAAHERTGLSRPDILNLLVDKHAREVVEP
jgi:hypothetical protein